MIEKLTSLRHSFWESNTNCQTMSYGPVSNRCCAEGSGKEPHELHPKINCEILCISDKWKWVCMVRPADVSE